MSPIELIWTAKNVPRIQSWLFSPKNTYLCQYSFSYWHNSKSLDSSIGKNTALNWLKWLKKSKYFEQYESCWSAEKVKVWQICARKKVKVSRICATTFAICTSQAAIREGNHPSWWSQFGENRFFLIPSLSLKESEICWTFHLTGGRGSLILF